MATEKQLRQRAFASVLRSINGMKGQLRALAYYKLGSYMTIGQAGDTISEAIGVLQHLEEQIRQDYAEYQRSYGAKRVVHPSMTKAQIAFEKFKEENPCP